jgi:hypothetical protein
MSVEPELEYNNYAADARLFFFHCVGIFIAGLESLKGY